MKDTEKGNNNENVMHNYKNLTREWDEKRMNRKYHGILYMKIRKFDLIVRDVQWKFYIQRIQRDT